MPGVTPPDQAPATAEALDLLLAAPPRLGGVRLVAVDGPSGSGKSTFAARLVADLRGQGHRTALVPTDHFASWENPVAWWPALVDGVLLPLAAGRAGRYRRLEWSAGWPRLGDVVPVEVPDVLVVEGVSAARRSVLPVLSCAVWLELADPAERLDRVVTRDGESCRAPLLGWQAFEEGWFAVDDPCSRADLHVNAV